MICTLNAETNKPSDRRFRLPGENSGLALLVAAQSYSPWCLLSHPTHRPNRLFSLLIKGIKGTTRSMGSAQWPQSPHIPTRSMYPLNDPCHLNPLPLIAPFYCLSIAHSDCIHHPPTTQSHLLLCFTQDRWDDRPATQCAT